jgi:hypothetical protein
MSSWAEKLRNNLPDQQQQKSTNNNNNNLTDQKSNNNNNQNNNEKKSSSGFAKNTAFHSSGAHLLLNVFHFLSSRELALKCAQVCHAWRNIIHEPVTWQFAWPDWVHDVEVGFGRGCFDPLPQLLRLAGISPLHQTKREMKKQHENAQKETLLREKSGWQNQQQEFENKNATPGGLLSQEEIDLIFKLSAATHYNDERYKRIVRSGSYRLRFILSLLVHSHELRRDLNFQENFEHSKNLPVLKMLLRRRLKPKVPKAAVAVSSSSQNNNTNDNDQEQQQQNQQQSSSAANSPTTTPTTTPPISPNLGPASAVSPAAVLLVNVFQPKPRTSRVRCFSLVDRNMWNDWLKETQMRQEREFEQEEDVYNQDEEEEEVYEEEQQNDDDDENVVDGGMKSKRPFNSFSALTTATTAASTSGSLTTLETLQTLRSSPVFLSATQALNIFSHMHAGAPLPPSMPVAIVDSTECVHDEDNDLLNDIAFLVLGEDVYHSATRRQQKMIRNGAHGRKLRLVEINLKLADELIKSGATKAKERETALSILADFVLRPLSRYFPPCALDQVDWTMRVASVGRSNPSEKEILASAFPNQPTKFQTPSKPSFLSQYNNNNDDDLFSDDIFEIPPEDPVMNNETQETPSSIAQQQQKSSLFSELALSECLSLLVAPKFFTGPELCGEHSVTILIVDPLRLYLVKLRC